MVDVTEDVGIIEKYVREVLSVNMLNSVIRFVVTIAFAVIVFVVGKIVIKKLLEIFKKYLAKKSLEEGTATFLISLLRFLSFAILIIVICQILGFATSSIIAVIGSAGLAIGLAIQGSLANFAGGILILIMKPFVVGDYILVGDVEGTVQKIDVVYTTLSTIDNRAVILPNGKLADSNIINVTREDKRRVDLTIGIEYSEDIKKVRNLILDVINKEERRMKELPVDVIVASLGESSVNMGIHVWTKPEDYWPVRWALLEEIKEEFDRQGIVIPFNQLDINLNDIHGKAQEIKK